MRALFYKIFYRPLPFFQWFNKKRHVAIITALSVGATPKDKARMERLQKLTSWMMLPMTVIDHVHFWSIKRNVRRLNKNMDRVWQEFEKKYNESK